MGSRKTAPGAKKMWLKLEGPEEKNQGGRVNARGEKRKMHWSANNPALRLDEKSRGA